MDLIELAQAVPSLGQELIPPASVGAGVIITVYAMLRDIRAKVDRLIEDVAYLRGKLDHEKD